MTAHHDYTRLGGLLVPSHAVPTAVDTAPVVATGPDVGATAAPAAPAPVKVSRRDRRRQRREAAEQAARDARMDGRTRRVDDWTAKAAEARRLRALLLDPDVMAVRLMRQRARWTVMAWSALVFALAFTMVNVQRFAAGTAEPWSPTWLVAWVVDPAFSVLLVGLLIARGQLSAVGRSVHEPVVRRVEYGLLASTAAMNVMPTVVGSYPGGWSEQVMQIVLHLIIPGLAFAAALVITLIQDHFAAAIASLTDAPVGEPVVDPAPVDPWAHATPVDPAPAVPVEPAPAVPVEPTAGDPAPARRPLPTPVGAQVHGRGCYCELCDQIREALADRTTEPVVEPPAEPTREPVAEPVGEPGEPTSEPVRPRFAARSLTAADRVKAVHQWHPDATHEQIAELAGCSPATVKRYRPKRLTNGSPSGQGAAETGITKRVNGHSGDLVEVTR